MGEQMPEPKLWATPEYADAMIAHVWRNICRVYGNIHQHDLDDCYGHYEGELGLPGVKVRPYSWDDSPNANDEPNIKINGVGIWWYKYFGRGMEADVDWTPGQWAEWLDGCMKMLNDIDRKHFETPLSERPIL